MKNEKIINEIVKDINNLSGKHSSFEIFSDWVTMGAITIQNACCHTQDDVIYQKRKKTFEDIEKKYTEKELKIIFELYSKLINAFENEKWDYLGEIFMNLNNSADKKIMGQCFTPFEVSMIMAKINLKDIKEEKSFTLYEPTCGAGGMIISTAKELFNKGINYQNCMKVVAQDLNILCVYMAYLQLSLLNVNAVIGQGDTLEEPNIKDYPKDRIFRTPANLGFNLCKIN